MKGLEKSIEGAEQRLCEGCGVPTSWSLYATRLLYVFFPEAQVPRLAIDPPVGGLLNKALLSALLETRKKR